MCIMYEHLGSELIKFRAIAFLQKRTPTTDGACRGVSQFTYRQPHFPTILIQFCGRN